MPTFRTALVRCHPSLPFPASLILTISFKSFFFNPLLGFLILSFFMSIFIKPVLSFFNGKCGLDGFTDEKIKGKFILADEAGDVVGEGVEVYKGSAVWAEVCGVGVCAGCGQ